MGLTRVGRRWVYKQVPQLILASGEEQKERKSKGLRWKGHPLEGMAYRLLRTFWKDEVVSTSLREELNLRLSLNFKESDNVK